MRIIHSSFLALAVVLGAAVSLPAEDGLAPPLRLDGGPSASIGGPLPSAAELRQRRALERQRQRDMRREAYAWAGYDPARPMVSANPYTQLRYPMYRTVYVWPVRPYPAR